MDDHWDGDRPKEIPMMPDGAIDFAKFKQNKQTKSFTKKDLLPLGLEFEEVIPLAYDPMQDDFLTVVSDRKDGVDRLINALAKNMTLLKASYQTVLVDTADQGLSEIGSELQHYVAEADDVSEMKDDLISKINHRKEDETEPTKQLIMIKDFTDFLYRSHLMEEELPLFFEEGSTVGIHFIVCGDDSFIGSSYESEPKYVRRQSTIGLLTMKLSDQDLLKPRNK